MVINQTKSAIQASEKRYRQLFENIPICIVIVNLAVTPAVIFEVNRRAEIIYGSTAAELVGKPVSQLVPEESRESFQNLIERVQRGETVTTEINNRHRGDSTFPVRVIATLDPTHSGYMIIAVEDISVEKLRHNDVEAIEAERLRIAHEIHDGVAQNLAALHFKSALWQHLANEAPSEMKDALAEVQVVLTAAIEDIRRAIFALRPLDMESVGFFPALTQWLAGFGDQNQLVVHLEIFGQTGNLPANYELPLFRIIQEGLNNIRQHAQASSAWVRLSMDEAGAVQLSLRDNGRGFDPSLIGTAGQSNHFGLRQMRERIQDLGGTLNICSLADQGTELLIRLPRVTETVNGSLINEANDAAY